MANFCCSIETEPRTLKQEQLSHVREIAADIVQKKEPDTQGSISLFSKDINAAVSIKEVAATATATVVVEEYSSSEVVLKGNSNVEKNCQCSFSALTMDTSPEECRVKEPLSAPF